MRKLIAFIMLSLFSLLFKNEKGSCESNCQISCPKKSKSFLKTDVNTERGKNTIKPYDGFFIKI